MKKKFSTNTRAWLLTPALLGFAGLLLTACQKDDVVTTQDPSATDEALLKAYIADNKITNAQRQPSGLYFVPDSVNTTLPLIAANSKVSVVYTGQLLNGSVFDSNAKPGGKAFQFVLGTGQVIQGWDIGVALMHKGDKARLLIPSALGYGGYAVGTIPPYSPLVFTVRVTNVQ